LEAGAGLHEVRDTLGHSNITMTSTYLSTTTAGMKTAIKELAAHRRRKQLRVVAR
jgi:site-specific recombinase XerD